MNDKQKIERFKERTKWIDFSRVSGKEIKIPSDRQHQGSRLSAQNVEQHYQIAEILFNAKKYGPARSHLILAAEESIKTMLLLANEINENEAIPDFNLVFNHKGRLILAAFMGMPFELIDQLRNKLTKEKQSKDELLRWVKNIERNIESGTASIFKVLEWWGNAGNLRNDGFYVDYRFGKWYSPSRVRKSAYLNAKKRCDIFINMAIASNDLLVLTFTVSMTIKNRK